MRHQNVDNSNPDIQIDDCNDELESIYFDLESLLNMIATDDNSLK